jgi:hypothetical protein
VLAISCNLSRCRSARVPHALQPSSVVHLEERLRCNGNVSVSLCPLRRYKGRHQLKGPACTQIRNSDQSGRIGPETRAGLAQLRQRLRLRLHQAQGLLVPRHSPKSAVPMGHALLLRKHEAEQARSRDQYNFRRECGHVRGFGSFAAVISCSDRGAEQGPVEFLLFSRARCDCRDVSDAINNPTRRVDVARAIQDIRCR